MELIKNHKIVIVSVLILLVLILFRSMSLSHFKSDAKKWAEPSLKKSNRLTITQAGSLAGKSLIINLDKNAGHLRELTGDIQNIPADSVLSKIHIAFILKHDGPVLLFSSEPGLSAKIWMIIRQMGCRNIFILTDSVDNEALKYKFYPDSIPGTR
jgi:hypothetical protein